MITHYLSIGVELMYHIILVSGVQSITFFALVILQRVIFQKRLVPTLSSPHLCSPITEDSESVRSAAMRQPNKGKTASFHVACFLIYDVPTLLFKIMYLVYAIAYRI
jgi:hypothetical protein